MTQRYVRVFSALFFILSLLPVRVTAAGPGRLIISAYKVSSTTEFIEVYNPDDIQVDTNGWKLSYVSASSTTQTPKTLVSLTGKISPREYGLFATAAYSTGFADPILAPPVRATFSSGLADAGGVIKLYAPVAVDANYPDGLMLVQAVGWKNTAAESIDPSVKNTTSTKAFQRCIDATGIYAERSDNRIDFYAEADAPQHFSARILCPDIAPISVAVPPSTSSAPAVVPASGVSTVIPLPAPDPTLTPVNLPPILVEPLAPALPPPPAAPMEGPLPVDHTPGPVLSCEGVEISEVLPNPAGADEGKEFIELHNSTEDFVELNSCLLKTSAAAWNSYTFISNTPLAPDEYLALTDAETTLVLPNSSGATVTLVSVKGVELSKVTYPADLDDDQAWAYDMVSFSATYTPTKDQPNLITPLRPCGEGYERYETTLRCRRILTTPAPTYIVCSDGYVLNSAVNRCTKTAVSEPAACASGQERNPQTGRCRNVTADVDLASCPAGQERNLDTSRCRTTFVVASALVPCAVNQYRNPDTNRCRLIEPAAAEVKPCPAGQERNVETNRCRKVLSASSTADTPQDSVKDVQAGATNRVYSVGLALLVAGVIGYAIYEWRSEVIKRSVWVWRRVVHRLRRSPRAPFGYSQ